jgi:hypothetical protein
MKAIAWLAAEFAKTFIWVAILCAIFAGLILLMELSLFDRVLIGGFILLLIGAYLYEKTL